MSLINTDIEAIDFKKRNIVIGEGQKEYKSLPAHIENEEGGFRLVTTCYKLPFLQRLRVLLFGKVYFQVKINNGGFPPQRAITKF